MSALSLKVSFTGLDAMVQNLGRANVQKAISLGVQRSAQQLRDDTAQLPPVSAKTTGYDAQGIPVDTGLTRQSLQTFNVSMLAAGVIANTGYSGYVHDGTSKMPARPFFLWALELGSQEKMRQIFEDYLAKAVNGGL